MPTLVNANIPWPDFANLQVIDPDKFDANYEELQTKFNAVVSYLNTMQAAGLPASAIVLKTLTEVQIKDFTLNDGQATAYTNTADLNTLLSFIAKRIKEITGASTWDGTIIKSLVTIGANIDDINTALNLKAPINNPTFTGVVSGVTPAMIGLGSVDNTSDANKPVSTATLLALNEKESITNVNTHKSSSDHDSRYLSKTNADSFIPTNLYHPATKQYVDTTIAGVTMGIVPDNSVTETKLHTTVVNKINTGLGAIGSLATLTTTNKTTLVEAVNEVNAKPTTPADNSITNTKLATDIKIGSLAALTTSVKTSVVNAINSLVGVIVDGTVTWQKLSSDIQNRELKQDKAITELLMLADIDSKVFSPNLGKFYANFTNTMDYSLGTIDSTKQMYTGTLSAGATNVVLPSATGFSAGQEISIQDATNYEDVIVQSVVSTTVSFKTPLTNSYTNPIIYRSNNNEQSFSGIGITLPSGAVFGSHFDGNTTDFVSAVVPTSNTGTFDTSVKKFGTASISYNGSQYTEYADSTMLDIGAGNFYVDFWVNRSGGIGSTQYFVGQSDSTLSVNSIPFFVGWDATNVLLATVAVGSTWNNVVSATVVNTTGVWNHVRFGRDGNNLRIFFNGVLEGTTPITGTANNSSAPFSIGRCGAYPNFYLNGKIDEFLFVKGVSPGSSNFTPPIAPYGTNIQTTKNVIRMNITPYEPVKYISAWLTKTDLAGFTADGKVSIVGAAADESYVDLTESITELGSTQEVMMIGNAATADSKVTLKLELNRASTSDSVSFTKLIGGVSA